MTVRGKTGLGFRLSRDRGRHAGIRAFKGRVLLVANTASFCGYTSVRRAGEAAHQRARGSDSVGVPSQDFNQESPPTTPR